MSLKRSLSLAMQALVVLAVLSLLVGAFLGQPVLFGFVETGSMQPTLDPGDGFIAVPTPLAGPISTGDVVTFDAQEIEGGGLTTHRVVDETDRGYITRGDNNPFTDQDSGEPVVQDADIVAVGLSVGGSLVVIPHLGTAVMGIQSILGSIQQTLALALGTRALLGTQGLAYLIMGLSALAYVVDLYLEDPNQKRRERSRDRDRDDGVSTRTFFALFAVMLMIAATAAMVVPAGDQEFGVVSAEFESDRPTVIERGTSEEIEYLVPNSGLVPVQTYFSPASDEVAVEPEELRVGGRSEESVDVTLTAPDETGYYRLFMTEHRYLAVLPAPVIDELYQTHPWAPLVAINLLIGGGTYAVGLYLSRTGHSRVRVRESRDRSRSLRYQLIQYLRH